MPLRPHADTPANVKLREFLLAVFDRPGRLPETPVVLARLAGAVLRNVHGGRRPGREEVEDLTQDFLAKVVTLGARGTPPPFATSSAAETAGWVRATLRTVAIDGNPHWGTQRALRDVVKVALAAGLPPAAGRPVQLERGGRFVRELVAAACADLLVERPVSATVPALTRALMDVYGPGATMSRWDDAVLHVPCVEDCDVEARDLARHVVQTFLAEVGPEGRELLHRRRAGFAEMARRSGVALATVHGRFQRVVGRLADIGHRLGATSGAMRLAIEHLSA